MPFGSGQNHLQYRLAGDKLLGLACECSFGVMEWWVEVLFICFHFVWSLDLYFHAIRGCSVLTPVGSPWGWSLADWSMYNYDPITMKELVFYCNTAWPMYSLDSREKWSLKGSLNYYTIIYLELFCQWFGEWNKIPHIQAFMSLHNKESPKKGNNLIMQRNELAFKPLSDSKTQEENEKWEGEFL